MEQYNDAVEALKDPVTKRLFEEEEKEDGRLDREQKRFRQELWRAQQKLHGAIRCK